MLVIYVFTCLMYVCLFFVLCSGVVIFEQQEQGRLFRDACRCYDESSAREGEVHAGACGA